MTQSPVNERLTVSAAIPDGRFVPNGLRCFLSKFSEQSSMKDFVKWRENPVTIAYLSALRTLSVTPPAGYVNADSIEVQYGVQSGVTLALSLAEDPTALYPALFTGTSSGAPLGSTGSLQTDYSAAPDEIQG